MGSYLSVGEKRETEEAIHTIFRSPISEGYTVCRKLESTHGVAPAPGENHLHFFVFNKVSLGGHICNELIIFIAPH